MPGVIYLPAKLATAFFLNTIASLQLLLALIICYKSYKSILLLPINDNKFYAFKSFLNIPPKNFCIVLI